MKSMEEYGRVGGGKCVDTARVMHADDSDDDDHSDIFDLPVYVIVKYVHHSPIHQRYQRLGNCKTGRLFR